MSCYLESLEEMKGQSCHMGNEFTKNKDRLQEEEKGVKQRLENEEKSDQDHVEKPVDWQSDPVEDSESPGEIYVHSNRSLA